MLYPLSLATVLIYYLYRSRNSDCDCRCGQNRQNCKSGCIICPPPCPPPCPRPCPPPCPPPCPTQCPRPCQPPCPPPCSPPRPPSCSPPCPRPCPRRCRKKNHAKIICIAVTISITAGISAPLIARAFFVPPMPSFALPAITVNTFDISTPNVIRANFQALISSRTSNNMFRFYFDRLRIYVTYRGQQITFSTPLPPNPEGQNQIEAWTANLCGTPVTLEPNNAMALTQEQITGSVKVTIRIDGQVRWKFWFFPFVKHKFSVKCSASIPIGSQQTQITVQKCSVKL